MRLRFTFDAGAGVCLWALDPEAQARFGYQVEASMLPVPEELRAEIEHLVQDYDDTFPWDDPGSNVSVAPHTPVRRILAFKVTVRASSSLAEAWT